MMPSSQIIVFSKRSYNNYNIKITGLGKEILNPCQCLPSLNHTIRAVLLLHGLQQQQQQQQKQPVMIDSTSNRNTNTSTMRTAVLCASHQRTKPAGKSYTVVIFR